MYADYDKGVPVKYKDSCIQTDLTVDQIEEMERDSEQLKDKECLHRNLIVEKIIESDKTVKEYTGFPSKKILNGVFGKKKKLRRLAT